MKAINFALVILLLCACQPGTGEFNDEPDPDPGPSNPVVGLAEIQEQIFSPICVQCHAGSQAPLGLRLDSAEISYANLVNIAAVGNSSFDRVEPFEPDTSFLMLKVLGDPVAGQRMPLGMAPLDDSQIALIRNWIEQGAQPVASQSLVKLSRVDVELSDSSTVTLVIHFNGAVQRSNIQYESLLVYQIFDNYPLLLTSDDYQVSILNDREVQLEILKSALSTNRLKLIIGDENPLPIVDVNGSLIDADSNDLSGGVYEADITWK